MKLLTTSRQFALFFALLLLVCANLAQAGVLNHGLNVAVGCFPSIVPGTNTTRCLPIASMGVTGMIDGVPVNHRGTMKSVLEQVDAEDNTFRLSDHQSKAYHKIEARSGVFRSSTTCLPINGLPWAKASAIGFAADYEDLWTGNLICWAPPETCVRVACADDAALYYCNYNTCEIGHPCSQIGDLAVSIRDQCSPRNVKQTSEKKYGGQVCDSNNFCIIGCKDTKNC